MALKSDSMVHIFALALVWWPWAHYLTFLNISMRKIIIVPTSQGCGEIKLDNVNNALSTMPGINGKHSMNVKCYYYFCYFLFHITILLLSKLVSLDEGSHGICKPCLVFLRNLRDVDSSGHCNEYMVESLTHGTLRRRIPEGVLVAEKVGSSNSGS